MVISQFPEINWNDRTAASGQKEGVCGRFKGYLHDTACNLTYN
jgi:hypothetical protein